MVKLNLQQIKKIELDILKEFVAYCDKHSLSNDKKITWYIFVSFL